MKKTAEKITSLGLKKLFFGVAVGTMVSEAYNDPDEVEKNNQEIFKINDTNIKEKFFQRTGVHK